MNYEFPEPTEAFFSQLSSHIGRDLNPPVGCELVPNSAFIGQAVTFFLPGGQYVAVETTDKRLQATVGESEEWIGNIALHTGGNPDLFDRVPPIQTHFDSRSSEETYKHLRSVANLVPLITFCIPRIPSNLARICQAASTAGILSKAWKGDLSGVIMVPTQVPQVAVDIEGQEVNFSYN